MCEQRKKKRRITVDYDGLSGLVCVCVCEKKKKMRGVVQVETWLVQSEKDQKKTHSRTHAHNALTTHKHTNNAR